MVSELSKIISNDLDDRIDGIWLMFKRIVRLQVIKFP